MSEETISRITDKVIEEMTDWQSRPLDRGHFPTEQAAPKRFPGHPVPGPGDRDWTHQMGHSVEATTERFRGPRGAGLAPGRRLSPETGAARSPNTARVCDRLGRWGRVVIYA